MVMTNIAPIPNFGIQDAAKKQDGGGSGFGEMLESVMGDFLKTQHVSETTAGQAITGKANLVDVMTSVTNAETSLQLLVAIRDKLVQSYQEIMRMPI